MKQYQAGVMLPEHTGVYLLEDDGVFLNNGDLPVVHYIHAFQLSHEEEAAADQVEKLLEENAWHHPWRNGIYDYHHFHSTAHEVLVCYAGSARIQLGGPSGVILDFKQGDVLLLPAGTAHKCLEATADFKCIGAYPRDQLFDMCYGDTKKGQEPGNRSERCRRLLRTLSMALTVHWSFTGIFNWPAGPDLYY